ncbi:hypothetical protein [Tumebacillus permanentifrigoris]|uniref:Uncharacterized protein n=1 Tax=Tumebacillus permanentifrigoris TaxID=378543 RepID=A0A316D9W8_9BACL|nr:hypothetical protein [Tumebacillus permanentifrigoris]PWK13014.1 hypothetical protein C7459_10832 [Tumebacillus permanentifrigoris]
MINIGTERIYNKHFEGRDDVIKWDVQPITNSQLVQINFLSTNSPNKQGIFLRTDKGIEANGQLHPGIYLWEDTAPREVIIKCFTENGWLSIYNIHHNGRNQYSQGYSAGMLLQEEGDTLVYHCNDVGLETNFDKLVFSVKRL